jgi:replicative DNA helicase
MSDTGNIINEPPHSDDAELAVLGGIFLRNNAFDQVGDTLKEEDFYRTSYRHVYASMRELHHKREPIDALTLAEQLTKAGNFEAVGGVEFLSTLGDATPLSANIVHYAKIVSEKALLRQLIAASHEILSRAYSASEDVEEVLDSAVAEILDIAQERAREGIVPLDQIIHETIQQLAAIAQSGVTVSGVPSGFYDLDNITNGFQKGDLIIIAARPSMGKTAFALNVATHAASKKGGSKKVLIFSMEMPRAHLGQRLLCSEAGISLSNMRTAQMIEANYQALVQAGAALYETKLFIDDTGNLSVMDIRAKARRLQAEKGLDMIIIDYIQLMRVHKDVQSREQEISSISRGLKILAKELGIPILALAQLNRMVEQRDNKRPRPSDLRESGALEQDSDLILFIYRDFMYNKNTEDPDLAEIIVGKHRNGPLGTVRLKFEGQFTRFVNRSGRDDMEDVGY